MKFQDPYTKGKTVTRTIRIDEGYDDILKYEAERKGVSVNTILDQQLRKYVQSYRYFENLSAITLSATSLHALLNVIEEEEILAIGTELGKERPYELILKRGIKPSYESAKWYILDVLGDQSGWLSAAINVRGGNEYIHLSHPFGYKWSLFLQGYFGIFFREIVGVTPEIDVLSSSITFTFKIKDIEKVTGKKTDNTEI
ncbi:hypothetical protein E4H04_02820 [Candidatus Bathyarchaeota archaeon]|nr:MAG: hypothetical protein E4H04_02820 [Candidatus Bathyarchaeota archaeon]